MNERFLRNVIEVSKNKPVNLEKLEIIPKNWLNDENLKWVEQNDRIIK